MGEPKPMYRMRAMFEYAARSENELTLAAGDDLVVLGEYGEWTFVENARCEQGMVPMSFLGEKRPLEEQPKPVQTASATGRPMIGGGVGALGGIPNAMRRGGIVRGGVAGLNKSGSDTQSNVLFMSVRKDVSIAEQPAVKYKAIALYDYEGDGKASMSFKTDDVVEVLNDDVAGGWWLVSLRGTNGHVPGGFFKKADDAKTAEEEKVDAESIVEGGSVSDPEGEFPDVPFKAVSMFDYAANNQNELNLSEGEEFTVVAFAQLGWVAGKNSSGVLGHVPRGWVSVVDEKPVICQTKTIVRAKVLFKFKPQGANQLALEPGDIIAVRNKPAGEWWEGEHNGDIGFFPSNFVQIINEDAAAEPEPAAQPVPAENPAEKKEAPKKKVSFAPDNQLIDADPYASVHIKPSPERTEYIVTSSYKAKDFGEITLSKGQTVFVFEESTGPMWTVGSGDEAGKFPKKYLKLASEGKKSRFPGLRSLFSSKKSNKKSSAPAAPRPAPNMKPMYGPGGTVIEENRPATPVAQSQTPPVKTEPAAPAVTASVEDRLDALEKKYQSEMEELRNMVLDQAKLVEELRAEIASLKGSLV